MSFKRKLLGNQVTEKIKQTTERINQIRFDAHYYRRAFHAFGSSFLWYYTLPDSNPLVHMIKIWVPAVIVLLLIFVEALRMRGTINGHHFFGLRMYERKRIGSYVFFGIGILILLLFFPQQIAVPCILCATLGDPFIGEIRYKVGRKKAIILGFLMCVFFFGITWYKAPVTITSMIALVGGATAIIGEAQPLQWLDDDLLIQLLPALVVGALWLLAQHYLGINILPEPLIYPGIIGGF